MMEEKFFVYILECEDGTLYTGYTTDLERRFSAHLSGKGAKYTRSHKPAGIVYYEVFDDRHEALSREWHIKKMKRREKEMLIKTGVDKKSLIDHNKIKRRRFMKEFRVFKCSDCGKIMIMAAPSGCPTMCCGKEMVELTANTTDAAQEKHVPAVTREGNKLTVNVGSVDHPMEEKHYIEWIALVGEKGYRIAYLEPGDKPCVDFYAAEPVTAVYAYCNLHGLWKTEA